MLASAVSTRRALTLGSQLLRCSAPNPASTASSHALSRSCVVLRAVVSSSRTGDGQKPAMKEIDPRETSFAKIIAGQIPSKKVFEDDQILVIHDINPQAPVHVLLLPKKPIGGIGDAAEDDRGVLGHLFASVPKVAKQLNLDHNGYRLVVNEGIHGQQSVRWLHVHLIGGRQLTWPPG